MKLLPLPHIAYGASSVLLNDDAFKYFARTNPDDAMQARNMVRLLQKLKDLGHDIKTVNVIYSDSVYGTTAAEVCSLYRHSSDEALMLRAAANFLFFCRRC